MAEPETLTELIEDCKYLLEFQKKQLLEDLQRVPSDKEHMEKVMDAIFYKLFDTGWSLLSPEEQRLIREAWKEAWSVIR